MNLGTLEYCIFIYMRFVLDLIKDKVPLRSLIAGSFVRTRTDQTQVLISVPGDNCLHHQDLQLWQRGQRDSMTQSWKPTHR